MTKAIVETIGSFQLTGTMFDRSDAVPFDRPAVVLRTGFIDAKIGADVDGKLKLYGNVSDEATDADWLEHITECGFGTKDFDPQFAYESYPFAQTDDAAPPEETKAEKKVRLAAEAARLAAEEANAQEAARIAAEEQEAAAEAARVAAEEEAARVAVQAGNDTSKTAPKSGSELQKG